MRELIYKQDAIDGVKTLHEVAWKNWHEPTLSANFVIDMIKDLPSAQPEIIRCKDCKWWDRYGEGRMGYCHAIKHHYYTTNWEIHILRTYRDDFYCADAEVREEEEDDER